MHPFISRPRASLRCLADFSVDQVLNIDFLAPSASTEDEIIPFHLSLRRAEGLVVVNRRHAAGWRREILLPMNFPDRPVAVEVRFASGRVTLWVDGRRLGGFDALPRPSRGGRMMMRHGFPGLGRIERVRLLGGLKPESLQLHCPGLPRNEGQWQLTDALTLECKLPADTGQAGAVELSTPGSDTPLIAWIMSGVHVDENGQPLRLARVVLPGTLWLQADDEGVELRPADGTAAPIRLTQADLVAPIVSACRSGLWDREPMTLLNAVEHCRHAGLLPLLPVEVADALLRKAHDMRLEDWLTKGIDAPPTAVSPPSVDDALPGLFERHRHRVLSVLRRDPGSALDELTAALAEDPLPDGQAQELLRALAEPFCAAGRIDSLFIWAQARAMLPLTGDSSAWHETTALPFDLALGWFDAPRDRLSRMASTSTVGSGWTVTPLIGWTVKQMLAFAPALDGTRPDLGQRERVVWAFLNYLQSLGEGYWTRSPCIALQGALIAILTAPDGLSPPTRQFAASVAVKLYGLSPGFWAALRDATPATLPGDLAEAEELCTALVAEVLASKPDRKRIDQLLWRASALWIQGASRYRRELMGPTGLPQAWPEPSALQRRGLDPDEACLRALVHPNAPAMTARIPEAQQPAVREAAIRGLVSAYPRLHRSPLRDLELRQVTEARALMDAPDADGLARWARALTPLCGADQGHAGLTLALGLVTGLARRGARPLAEALIPAIPGPRPMTPAHGTVQAVAVLARHDPALAQHAGAVLGLDPGRAPGPRKAIEAGDDVMAAADPIFDTLVAVYSCRPNLETRVAEMRDGWLGDLAALGIPFLVFTGDGDGERIGDVVHLDAPDDYEGLPEKSLAMVRWVLENTHASRLLKVDDDCFLHAPAWFADLAPLRHDYYGRVLTLRPGQMDRTWHMAKSRSARGRNGLDKSPEPARYADGGSGYLLSRRAMAALIDAAESPRGQELRQLSFMEDKLTGDLLALSDIQAADEEYRTAVLRRSVPGGPLVPAWENGVLPFLGSPVKLVHLDDSAQQHITLVKSRRDWPAPGKIWPSYQPARSGTQSNTLDLLSPPSRLEAAQRAGVAVVACMRNEAAILPSFLAHYRKLGVGGFLIADNGSTDGTLEMLAQAPDVALFAVDTDYGQSHYGVAWQQALLSNFRVGKWSLVADADEFLVLGDGHAASLPDLVASPDFADSDAARVLMLDMYPNGPLSEVTLASGDPVAETGYVEREPFLRNAPGRGPFSNAETLTSALRHRLIPDSRPELFVAQKYALMRYRPWMRLSAGLHYLAEARCAPRDLLFAHVKYTAAFRAKAVAEVRRGQHFNDAEEYRKYLALVSEGREVLFDPEISVHWRDCAEVQRILGTGPAGGQAVASAGAL